MKNEEVALRDLSAWDIDPEKDVEDMEKK